MSTSPPDASTSRSLRIASLSGDINRALDPACHPDFDLEIDIPDRTELVTVDEADRLKTTALEALPGLFDRHDLGLILIGMPGFDRQLARSPHLSSRVGFAHQYRPIDPEDIPAVLAHYLQQLGHTCDPENRAVSRTRPPSPAAPAAASASSNAS
jgi:type II secretory pathway predicted ATPase ExeA